MKKAAGWLIAAVLALVLLVGPVLMGLMATLFGATSNQQQGSCLVPRGSGNWMQPTIDADGLIGSPFGNRYHPILKIWRMHNGVDLGNVRGTPIWSVTDGTVTAAVDGCPEGSSCNGGAGNTIAIDHGDGVTTKYLHLLTGSVSVRVGDHVTAGQHIADMGSTGLSTAPHLHFGVQLNGSYVDPDTFMTDRGVNVATTQQPTAQVPTVDSLAVASSSSATAGIPDTLTSHTSTGGVITLTRDQLYEAAITIGVADSLGIPQRGKQVALVTELQESWLGAAPSIRTPNSDQDVGNFQQRSLPGWYAPGITQAENVAWLNESQNAARVFFTGQVVSAEAHTAARDAGKTPAGPVGYKVPGLLDITGWQDMPVGQAAQRVQRSAFPDAYAKWEPVVDDILAVVDGIQPGGACGGSEYGQVFPPDGIPQSDRSVGSEDRLSPAAIVLKRAIAALFPEITTIGGWRATSKISTSDHPAGRAIDVMIDNYIDPTQIMLGDRVADFTIANHQTLKVKYVIWRQRIWTPSNPTWRPMADRGSDNDNHFNHVHISLAE